MKIIFKSLIFLVFLISSIYSDAVCDETTLITELKQDIADNNKLDCLRVPRDPPSDKEESENEKKLRIAAAWDSDCSFEADYDWVSRLKDIYGLEKGLVDVNGDSVRRDFENQADMCELVRAMIAGGLVPSAKSDVKDISEDSVDAIDCPGDGENGQSEICAVSGGSAAQKYSWIILLDGISFNVDGNPNFIQADQSEEKK